MAALWLDLTTLTFGDDMKLLQRNPHPNDVHQQVPNSISHHEMIRGPALVQGDSAIQSSIVACVSERGCTQKKKTTPSVGFAQGSAAERTSATGHNIFGRPFLGLNEPQPQKLYWANMEAPRRPL